MDKKLQCLYCMQEFDAENIEFFYETERGKNDTLFETFSRRFLDYNMPPRKGLFYRKGDQNVEVIDEIDGVPMKIRVKLNEQAMPSAVSSSAGSSIFGDDDDDSLSSSSGGYQSSGDQEQTAVYVDTYDETRDIVTKVCPHCHSRLPVRDMIGCKTHHVFLLGGTGAGKTTYLMAMLQQLEQTLNKGLHLATISFGAESEPYYRQLQNQYSKDGVLDATQLKLNIGGGIFPIVLDVESRSLKDQRAFIVLHDFPGEGMKQEEYLANLRELEQAETVIVIGDVNQFYNIDQERIEDIRYFEGDFDSMFKDIRGSAVPSMTASTIMCVLLKIDLIMMSEGHPARDGYIAPQQVLQSNDMSVHVNKVDTGTIDQVSRTIDANIQKVSHKTLTDHLKNVFDAQKEKPKCYKCFGVSTFTKTGSVWTNISDVSGTKHRVIEPILFLLAQWDLVAKENKKKEQEPEKRSIFQKIFGKK